ncbi:MAG: VOC family protein [Actinomycetota bacterium]|nr:VOC family protein [Actinomycetota bacterium]
MTADADTPLTTTPMLRLRQVALVAHELDPIVEDLRAVFGLEVGHRDPGVATFGLVNAILPVGVEFIEIVAPTREGTAAGRQLDRRGGDGGYMVITQTDDHARRRDRVADLGIRTVMELDEGDYRCMQLHPSDTGGSFLEIDWNEGGERHDGEWWPAGKDWRPAVRTDVVSAITAVEVEASDPAKVAARWGEIIEREPHDGPNGLPVLSLDGSEVRFVPSTGLPDGLSAMELVASDAPAARAAAEARGLIDDTGAIRICGVRFDLV